MEDMLDRVVDVNQDSFPPPITEVGNWWEGRGVKHI